MKVETKSLIVYVVIGIIVGYISSLARISYGDYGNYLSVLLAVIFFFMTALVSRKILKTNEKFKWFWSNGGWVYVFVWFISWIIFLQPFL